VKRLTVFTPEVVMEPAIHHLSDLFSQLGLPGDSAQIEMFIDGHRPLPDSVALAEASFWSASQARFLSEVVAEDADWVSAVEHLDAMLRR
jgi:hypothetical protein